MYRPIYVHVRANKKTTIMMILFCPIATSLTDTDNLAGCQGQILKHRALLTCYFTNFCEYATV